MIKKVKMGTYAAPIASLITLISILLLTAQMQGLAKDLFRLTLMIGGVVLVMRVLEKSYR